MRAFLLSLAAANLAVGCSGAANSQQAVQVSEAPFQVAPVASFSEPWAMAFLPDGRMLVTEKRGALRIVDRQGRIGTVTGTPRVAYGGQGGFGDVALHPQFAANRRVYLSWAEPGAGGARGAAVGYGTLALDRRGGGRIEGLKVIWRQDPKVSGQAHYSHRLLFAPDGMLFVSSGERQKAEPAQDLSVNLGKIVRLTDEGKPATGNPFAARGGIAAQIWSLGHRNVLGMAHDGGGRLWEVEMGPRGGDELNLVQPGKNYGWPVVSNGDNYDGSAIPDHPTRPEFEAPEVWWNPSISPSSLMIYSGAMFPQWKGSAFIGALSGEALIRVALDGTDARKAEQWDMGERIRAVAQGPDGAIWLLEDQRGGSGGRLLRLTPKG